MGGRNVIVALLFVVGVALWTAPAQGAKILSVFGYPGPSQYIFISALLKGLAKRGHEVTSISTFPQKQPVKNFRDIAIMENFSLLEDSLVKLAKGEQDGSFFEQFNEFSATGAKVVTNIFENPAVRTMMQNEHFDLIIVEIMVSEALLGLGEFFKAPVIAVSTFGTTGYIDYLVGNPSPLSYIPHMMMPFDNHMSTTQRLGNVLAHLMEILAFNYMILPRQEQVYQRYFPSASLSLDQARKNVSLVLLNNHFALSFPRPCVPNMIEVGGLHIKQQPDPLPQDLQQILDDATEGVIYFSMGSNIKSKDLTRDKQKVFLDTFRQLNMKVLWKFEADELPNKPDNVIIRQWFPQPSILAHRNVKLFISHGGFLSTTEAIFHGKPILGIPMLGDQFMNVKNAVVAGYALSLQFAKLSRDGLRTAIDELLNNLEYTRNVQRRSRQYKDQQRAPLETAIYWVEYVVRHEGAKHMRIAGQDLNFWQYHNIDVYAIVLVCLVAIIVGGIGVVCLLRKLVCGRRKETESKVKLN